MSDDVSGRDDCDFCRIVRGTEPARTVLREPTVVAFVPTAPATPGHTLVIPTRHVPDIWSLGDDDGASLFAATLKVARAVGRSLRPDGLNLIQSNGEVATQTVPHLHVHVLPRYEGDAMSIEWPETPDHPDATVESAWRALTRELR